MCSPPVLTLLLGSKAGQLRWVAAEMGGMPSSMLRSSLFGIGK